MSMIRTAMSPAKVRSGSPPRSGQSERSLIQKSLSRQPTPPRYRPEPEWRALINFVNQPNFTMDYLCIGSMGHLEFRPSSRRATATDLISVPFGSVSTDEIILVRESIMCWPK